MSEGDSADRTAQPAEKPLRVEFDLGEYGGPVSMPAAEARAWRDRELAAWDWVRQLPANEYAPVVNVFGSTAKLIRRSVDPALTSFDASPTESTARAIGEALAQAFKKGRLHAQLTPEARLVQELATTDKGLAAGALAYFWQVPAQPVTSALLRGMLRALTFETGLSDRAEKEAEALASLRTEWQERSNEHARQSSQQSAELEAMIAQRKAEGAEAVAAASKQREEHAAAHAEQMTAATKELTALQATFTAELALRAPVTYWSNKRQYHDAKAFATARWLATYVVVGLVAVFIAAAYLLNVEAANVLHLPVWHFALFASLFGLFVWVARILVRLMLSNQHLAEDARERVAIANTFLALVRGGKLPETATDKVLEALLRHSPDGIVRDDALPLVAEMLKKAE